MDPPYFDWQAHLFATDNPSDERFSLQHLLNIIPTDIPKNASEFDEELRDLIISLYSDSVLATETDESNKAALSDDDRGTPRNLPQRRSQPLECPNDDGEKAILANILGNSLQGNRNDGSGKVKTQTEPDIQNTSYSRNPEGETVFESIDNDELRHKGRTRSEEERMNDTKQSERNSVDQNELRPLQDSSEKHTHHSQSNLIRYNQNQIQIAHSSNKYMQKNENGRQVKAELRLENEVANQNFCPSKFTRYRQDDIEIQYSNGMGDGGSGRQQVIGNECRKADGATDYEEIVGKQYSWVGKSTNRRTKSRTTASSFSLPENQLCTSKSSVQSGANHLFETADEMHGIKLPLDINLHESDGLIGNTQLYLENLDQLGDGEAARLFTNVSSWLSRVSSESPRELLSTVSLMSDLPSGNYFEAENESKEREEKGTNHEYSEVEDQCSNGDKPSHLIKVMKSIKPHTLSVISEENVAAERPCQTEEDFSSSVELEASIVDQLDSRIDSGVSSIATMSNTVDIRGNESDSSIIDQPYIGNDSSVSSIPLINDANDILGNQSNSLINDLSDQPVYDNDSGVFSLLTLNGPEHAIDNQRKSSSIDQSGNGHDSDICAVGILKNTKEMLDSQITSSIIEKRESGNDVYVVIANGSKDQLEDHLKSSIVNRSDDGGQDSGVDYVDALKNTKYLLDDQVKSSIVCQSDSMYDTDLSVTSSGKEVLDNEPKVSIIDQSVSGQNSGKCSSATLHNKNSGLDHEADTSQPSSLDGKSLKLCFPLQHLLLTIIQVSLLVLNDFH